MEKDTKEHQQNVTAIDLKLASHYYLILLDLAKQKHCLTYGELVSKAKEIFPDCPEIMNAVPVATGRRLNVIRYFTEQHGHPDLTCLVINKGEGECGKGYPADPEKSREEVFAFDWKIATTDFDGYITKHNKRLVSKTKRKVTITEANDILYAYYKEHKGKLPHNIAKKRDLITKLLLEGMEVEKAYAQAVSELS